MPSKETLPWRAPSSPTFALLSAQELPGIGVASLRKLTARHEVSDKIMFAVANEPEVANKATNHSSADSSLRRATPLDIERAMQSATELVKECENLRINVISAIDNEYPPALRSIQDFPPIIYVKGNVSALCSQPCVAVVGTRQSSPVGEAWAFKISRALAQHSITVISGLALGIDSFAHAGALDGGGPTVAILAHGLDTVSPARNRELATRILDNAGALVSEHRPGTPPRPPEFVRRNRIQSGLSAASIIVESKSEGGAIHQANFTAQQNRELYVALPPEALQESRGFNDEGARWLIQSKKARAIRSQDQLLAELPKIRKLYDVLSTYSVKHMVPELAKPLW